MVSIREFPIPVLYSSIKYSDDYLGHKMKLRIDNQMAVKLKVLLLIVIRNKKLFLL